MTYVCTGGARERASKALRRRNTYTFPTISSLPRPVLQKPYQMSSSRDALVSHMYVRQETWTDYHQLQPTLCNSGNCNNHYTQQYFHSFHIKFFRDRAWFMNSWAALRTLTYFAEAPPEKLDPCVWTCTTKVLASHSPPQSNTTSCASAPRSKNRLQTTCFSLRPHHALLNWGNWQRSVMYRCKNLFQFMLSKLDSREAPQPEKIAHYWNPLISKGSEKEDQQLICTLTATQSGPVFNRILFFS